MPKLNKTTVASTETKVTKGGKAETKAPATQETPKVKKPAEYGIEKSKDLPWSEKKAIVIKSLQGLKAFSPTEGATAKQVIEYAATTFSFELTARDVRHYSYHAAKGGLTSVNSGKSEEGGRGYTFSLTNAGKACKPDAELAAVLKAKEEKAQKPAKEPKAPKTEPVTETLPVPTEPVAKKKPVAKKTGK